MNSEADCYVKNTSIKKEWDYSEDAYNGSSSPFHEVHIKEEPASPLPFEDDTSEQFYPHPERFQNEGNETDNKVSVDDVTNHLNIKQEPEMQEEEGESDENIELPDSHAVWLNKLKSELKSDLEMTIKCEPTFEGDEESMGFEFSHNYLSLYDKVKVEISEDHTELQLGHEADEVTEPEIDHTVEEYLNLGGIKGDESELVCRDCGGEFSAAAELSRHRRKSECPLTCELCEKKFSSECVLATHVSVHTGERPFACKTCDKRFYRICYLLKHRRRDHLSEQTKVSCHVCGKLFANLGHLQSHVRAHYRSQVVCSLTCDDCGKCFTRGKYLNRHKKRAHNEEKLRCKICNEVQKTHAALMVHVQEHMGRRPFNCAECGAAFGSMLQLTRHSKIHLGELPFPCPDCSLRFITSDRLRAHRRFHTGERPFACAFCGSSFKRQHNLAIHLRNHTGC